MARRQTTCNPCAVTVEAKDLEQGFKFPTKTGWPGASPSSCFPSLQSMGLPRRKDDGWLFAEGNSILGPFHFIPPVRGDTGKVKTVPDGKMLGGPETALYAYHPNVQWHSPLFSSEPKVGKRWPTCQIGPASHFCK